MENFSFWFDLKDTEGFNNRDAVHYDVRGFRDEAPRVVIDEPKTDRDVPADATVPVRLILDDDYGLHSSRLIYRLATGDSEPHAEVAIPLWTVDSQGTQATVRFVKHEEISYRWELSPLKLAVGTVITLYADARDFDTFKGPNIGKSREIRLRIVSKEDAARQSEDARRELREEIARVLTMQKQAMTPVENAMRKLSQTDRLPPKDRDDLNNGAMIQRQVSGRLNNRDEGVSARIARILDDQRNFKINNPDAQNQLEEMLARLAAIRDQNLGPAEQGLSRATKSLDAKNAPSADSQPLAGASGMAPRPTRQTVASQIPPKPRSRMHPSHPRIARASRIPRLRRRALTPTRRTTRGTMRARRLARAAMHRKEAIKRGMHRRAATSRASHRKRVRSPKLHRPRRRNPPRPTPLNSHSVKQRRTRRRSPTSFRRCSMV